MIAPLLTRANSAVRWLAVAAAFCSSAIAAAPDLTAPGAIASLKADPNASPIYGETYNLGPTGLRGWIYIGGGNGADGTITTESRQILVTVASAPGTAVLAVDDVILGAMAGSSGTVPLFTSDARKTFGAAITEAEKTGGGTLRVKRWRAGAITDENIPMTIMGGYTATAPYSCPKSALILANARNKLVSQLLADPAPSILTSDWRGAINGLALLAGVAPGDPDYATVQDRLQTYARALADTPPQPSGLHIWNWAYLGLFLGEYYLSTGDANVIPGVNTYTVALAQAQSMYGTFGHNAAVLRPDGSGRRSNIGYGPLNQVGIVANMAMVMGRKSLVSAGQVLDPEIDPAIQRGLDFFAWFVNKGPIPYGEHEPFMDGHSPNGKDASCAVLFGLQANRAVETEYFTRMTTAGFSGREYGHTGQGFSYLWGAMGANMGGSLAVAEYLKPVRWHLDLSRRTDGSFAYDGQEQYGAGKTADGTYLGASGYYQLNSTASYILTYSLPLKRLHITGRNAIPANTLDAAKVTNAVAAATFKLDCTNQTDYPVSRLISALSEYDPVVRHFAAIELGKRSLSGTQLTTLRNMLTGTDANGRMGACQALGLLQDPTALPLIAQRLDKTIETDSWVRAKAATAIRSYAPDTAGTYCNAMLANFAANATDPDVIDWNDPVQISNRYLSLALFGDAVKGGNNIATAAIAAPKNLLYPAVQAGLKQPDSYPRHGAAKFCYDRLTLADVQALPLDFIKVIEIESQADRMWGARPRASGIKTLAKHKISEGIPLALAMLEIPKGFEWGSDDTRIGGLNALAAYGDAARWTLPALRGYLGKWSPTSSQHTTLVNTIASIEAAITAPAGLTNLMAVANSQVVVTTAAKAITLTGSSPRGAVTFANVSAPAHGTLTGTAPNLTYTPTPGYNGPDFFTFQTADSLTTSAPGTVSIIVGTAGSGLKGEYFDNIDFTNLKLTRTDAQVDFDWGTGPPDAALGADTFSVRWDGLLLVPETGTYTFSTLNSDGVRLYVNGVPVIDGYTDQNTHWNDSTAVNLTAGQMVDLHLRYYENTGSAVAKLKWTGPSFAGANGAIIGSQWLYDGTGMIRTPYAHSQSVALIRNTPQPVTLMGSGGNLTYTVLTPPANGTLTGTAPDLVYTPSANYSGTDSFTFLVNNGTGNSTPATVSIGIWAGQPEDFFWAAAASGNWSGATSWINAAGAVAVPDPAGQAFYRMNFDRSGTYTATQDLSPGFQLNQLNVAGAVTFAGTNSLNFAANGPLPPQFNQNSSSAVAIDVPVSLAAMTTFGGSNSGAVILKGLVSGSGGLTQSSGGTLQIHGLTPNPYSGGTIVNNGTLQLGAVIDNISPNVVNPVGTGPVTLNGGTIRLEKVTAANPLIVNAGKIYHQNGWAATWSGPITLNASLTCDEKSTLNCTGSISGTGGLIKTNSGFVVLSGNNSFTGANQIAAGTLTCNTATALGTGPLDITTGAKVNLNFTGTRTIAALTYNGGPPLAPGTYGSTASSATNQNDTYFSGTGTLTILPLTTNTTLASAPTDSSTYGDTVTFTAIVSAPGAPATGSVTFKDGGAILGSGSLSLGAATFITDTLPAGNHTITATYEGSGDYSTSISEPLAFTVYPAPTPFEAWAAEPAQGLAAGVNAGPNDDPDHDNIVNLMEFVLGGEPLVSSQVIRPELTNTGGIWVFSFDRSTRSKSTTTLAVEYGSELTGWTPLVIPENSAGAVTITPGTSSDRVKVALPDSGTRLFVRLKVTQ